MGFLDNSTNNIILDAVLTDTGRRFLARNDGSFSIFKFGLGDDEVNYNIIQKYGRTVGREKIEKNTPIFEGLTNESQAQRHRLISVSNPNLIRLPNIKLSAGADVSTGAVTLTNSTTTAGRSVTLTLQQDLIDSKDRIDVDLVDSAFTVKLSNMFLEITGKTPSNVDGQQLATYYLTKTGSTSAGGAELSFVLNLKSLSNSMFSVYGLNNVITTYVRITGINSGAARDIRVNINK